MSEVQN